MLPTQRTLIAVAITVSASSTTNKVLKSSMNTIETKSERIRRDDGDFGHSSRGSVEGGGKERKKHKKRPKDGSKSKSSSDRSTRKSKELSSQLMGDSSSSKKISSRKQHSSSKSKEKKKKKKHKKRPTSLSELGGHEIAPMVTFVDPPKSQIPRDENGVSSDSSVDSVERHIEATVEVFSRNGIMERAASRRVQSIEEYDNDSFSSSSNESLSEESVEVEKPRRSNSSLIDRHKKEVIAALTPDQFMAVPRKPATRSNRPRTTSSSTPFEEVHNSSESVNRPPTVSRNVSSGSGPQASSRVTTPSQHNGVSRGVPPPPAPSTTPRKSSSYSGAEMDQHKKDMIKEICPDQFMTVTRKPAKLGAPRPSSGSSGPDITTTAPIQTTTPRPPSPVSHGPLSSSTSPPPTETMTATETYSSKDDKKSSRNFTLRGFNRKGKKKSK